MTTGTPQHRELAPTTVTAAVLTISDTRTLNTDTAGSFLVSELEGKGHRVLDRRIVKDDAEAIRATLMTWLERQDIQVIITTGGTGIARRDNTIQTIESLLEKPMPGFGEIFRMLSYQEVRGAAILSRALGGMARKSLIFALPGSLNAVQTGWNGILRDELSHLVWETIR
jgi:molybdenum cofactor biosynthesis protein B